MSPRPGGDTHPPGPRIATRQPTSSTGKDEQVPADASHVPGQRDTSLDRSAVFAQHVEPEIPVLLRVARTVTGSTVDAEDLVQETLVRAYRAVDRFDGRHPRAWLLTILRHTHLNMHRRRRPDVVEDVRELDGARPAFGAVSPDSAEDDVLAMVLEEELEVAVASLDPRFRQVLLLVDVDQLSYTEAAQVIGVPVGTVMSRLSRARARLRHQLRPTLDRSRSTP